MRMCFVLVIVLLASLVPVAAADVTGNWKGTLTPENREPEPALLVLKQNGGEVTGTGGGDESDRHEITNGKVTGDTVTFEIKQQEGILKFVLTQSGDTLIGQATLDRNGQQRAAKLNLRREK